MKQKEFELIANTIKGELFTSYNPNDPDYALVDGVDSDTAFGLIKAFSDSLEREYPNFDKAKFYKLF